jgi:hypothetical protein
VEHPFFHSSSNSALRAKIYAATAMFYPRLIGTILLSGLGLWFAISGHARFGLGGDPDDSFKRDAVIHVNARGLDAVAIGVFFIGLGVVNLALGIRDRRRIATFWTGAALLCLTAVYGAVVAVIEVLR